MIRWVAVVLLVLLGLVVLGVLIKLVLHRRLEHIDGFNSVHTEDRKKDEGTVIGHFGDDE